MRNTSKMTTLENRFPLLPVEAATREAVRTETRGKIR